MMRSPRELILSSPLKDAAKERKAADFPGRRSCLVAKGSVSACLFDLNVNPGDHAFPAGRLGRAGAVLTYASGRPVDLEYLMGRAKVPEPIFVGGAEIVDISQQRIVY